jgi:hypothetical protein
LSLAIGKEFDGAVGEQQNQQGKQNAAGIETPGEKQSGGEHGNITEGQRGRDLHEERATDEHRRQR